MAITGAVGTALRQEAPYLAEIQMGAQLIMDFQGARTGGRPYYWYRGTRYASPEKVPGWSFSRASVGLFDDSGGKLIQFPAGAPRITDRGLLVEGARTNRVGINNANPTVTAGVSMGGDAAATLQLVDDVAALEAAGLSGVVTGGKVFFVDNSLGVSTAFLSITGPVANTNPHTWSAYVRGSGAARFRTSIGGENIGTSFSLTSGYVRQTATASPVSTARVFALSINSGSSVYVILPQLEEGAVVSSPIPTNGAAVTRAGDVPLVNLASALTLPVSLSVALEALGDLGQVATQTFASLAQTAGGRITLERSAGGTARASDGGGVITGTSATRPGARILRGAVRELADGSVKTAWDGTVFAGSTTAPAGPFDRLDIGHRSGGLTPADGIIRSVILYGALDDTQLGRAA
ncbi:hypothetical protein CA606_18260 [Caulobacter vibrioides]|uniref:Uncharacterized protein n=1 Tax=Caulobacter vibrioides TaxID=155892 RepID=A0A290MYP5_CAUVI|nr:hypothetical protein [Caulobacter vibrioides]ATC34118.1 hypothetical protein CA606_18260 [Caulobacter vibrioides]